MERIRLVLIDDHALFRESLGRFFASEPDMEVVGQCARISETLAILQQLPADVLLLDFNLGLERGTDLIAAVRAAGYTGKILMVTAVMDADECLRALITGATGIFLKHNSPAALTRAIRLVAGGEAWLDRQIVQLMAERVPPEENPGYGEPLSAREEQVLQGVMAGNTNRKIGEELAISEGAVKAVIQQLFRKTGVRTRSQLVRAALEGASGVRQR